MDFADRFAGALAAYCEGGRDQKQLAEDAGACPSSISYYKRGTQIPRADTALALAKALGVRIEWLLEGKGPMRANAWALHTRALYEIDGILAEWRDRPVGPGALDVEAAFWEGFKRHVRIGWADLSPTVQIMFGNLLARVMHSYRRQQIGNVTDPAWRGKVAGNLLLRVWRVAQPKDDKATNKKAGEVGFDAKPRSTRCWIAAIAAEMEKWEDGAMPSPQELPAL